MIKATNIQKSYNGEAVLHGVSLSVAKGEFLSIMGESGSGKSTLLSIIGGHLAADGGEVLLSGEPLFEMTEAALARLRSTRIGFVFQSFKLIPTLNVKDNLLLPATLGGRAGAETEAYVLALARELKVDGLYNKYPSELSGGQCQRVAILRALAYRPELLILDEPTGALDSASERAVMEMLRRINRECGTTVIQVTHSPAVAAFGSRTVHLKDGVLVE
ncbi:MAG: ABC transporter ATP-binding protein [Clostridia bacterium]|nr:ABC transporter ATP-binding protein [Clostridia bacterium]